MPFVYFIHEEENLKVFKIGKTETHPAHRCDQLQTGNPRKLLIYRWIEIADHGAIEAYLHGKYRTVRIRGEWFCITRDQIDFECAVIMSSYAECFASGIEFLGGNKVAAEKDIEVDVKVSPAYPSWTDEDKIRVQEERKRRGKYRGKRDPRDAINARNAYLESIPGWNGAQKPEKIFTDD